MRSVFIERKILRVVLCIVLISVLTLTIVYAALSTVLEISGSAEVSSADWDIRLVNPVVSDGSVNSSRPIITSNTTASFSTTLGNPGDYYQFTIDVVNEGSIDAMIDSVTKMPELSDEQAKYIKYIVEYENGEVISNRQLVSSGSFVRLKVRVEYRKDISVSDLPKSLTELDLSFRVNYTQADESGSIVNNNGASSPYDVGNEVCFNNECFYVMFSNDDTVTMLAKYNLFVGNKVVSVDPETDAAETVAIDNPTGIQDERALGAFYDENEIAINLPWYGTLGFSSQAYWSDTGAVAGDYVFDSNSNLYMHVENYRNYLQQYVSLIEVRLMSYQDLLEMGWNDGSSTCGTCPDWLYLSTYWLGSLTPRNNIYSVNSTGKLKQRIFSGSSRAGIRPVIVISKEYFLL